MVKRMVVGVDGSEGAARALRWAAQLACEDNAEVIAVFARPPMVEVVPGLPTALPMIWRDELVRVLEERWCAPLRAAGIRFRARLEETTAPSALMHVADEEDADLIVVGAHGHGGFTDRVLGSVSYKVSHRAHQPVVIVPPEAA